MADFTPQYLLFTLILLCTFSANHGCNQIARKSLLSLPSTTSGQVTHIWLPSKGLKGNISSVLGNLSRLSHLNLSNNSLSGPLPTELFSGWNQLRALDLNNNHLAGDISSLFYSNGWPASIQIVDISKNDFNGMIQTLFLRRAWTLTELNVSHNGFTGHIPSSLCINSPSVRLLNFSFNKHSGQIPTELGRCSKLEVFRAGFNYYLSGQLPHDIYNATELTEISLPSSNLSGPINSDIVNLTKLTILELYYNQFSGKLPLNIGKLSKLKRLLLHMNYLTGSLPQSLTNCTNLIELNLRLNLFRGYISTLNFSSLQQLTMLDLGRNEFTGKFPASLYSCKSLKAIRLTHNRLEGQIMPEVLQLKLLQYLSLGDTKLTNLTEAIKVLSGCKSLRMVILPLNFQHEAMPSDEGIVDSLGFENLQMLSLGGCQLTGTLPSWLSKLKKLEVLDLSSKRITGSIPGWFSTLPRLFYLGLSNNLISGEFPKELCHLPALVLKQTAPPVEQSISELPIFVSENGTLNQYNYLTFMPPAIHVGNNCLGGNVPIEIGHLLQLHVLNLSHNSFSGNIPYQISELTNLEKLDLSANKFSGEIPASLTSLHFLSWLSVANNDLNGMIPSGTQLQSFDPSAYEGNPGLCGKPLPLECANIVSQNRDKEIQEEKHGLGNLGFHVSLVLGFITGFWGVCGPLFFNKYWRVAYFQFLDNLNFSFKSRRK
ncbi:hypothetical protein I3842_02G055000 [Carya illinoinensis]|uniref:Uncharacterized protein n=1 Tax=Carya illinoinensis TaxID=32201 RepID=A0A922FSG5_CARIL|nr:hypothetical protein I3842_02G055000 [Carya illinoinensis]